MVALTPAQHAMANAMSSRPHPFKSRTALLPWPSLVLLPGEVVDAMTFGTCGLKPTGLIVQADRILLESAEVSALVPITTASWSGTLGRTGIHCRAHEDLPHEVASNDDVESLRIVSMHAEVFGRQGSASVSPMLQELLPTSASTLGANGTKSAKAINQNVLRELFDKHEALKPGARLTMRLHNTGRAPLGFRGVLRAECVQ